ncbi:hypothetical protein [Cohnella silvisoli]|uniref:Beta-galactosidase trimerisation domain-containing protein n=1 Tax=Cohnella silvisoli TaxID=2873699 RepID=A0ABV1KPB4_9BACL|nr:hypothetical protein [Cohnella silvisoli]MCD9025556.1 hypothetical protein [Cohnella silvisoli]
MMKVHYSIQAGALLASGGEALLERMKRADVAKVWLHGYFFGRFASTIRELQEAKRLLERAGFEAGVINVPLGHPGNSLNPDDSSMELSLPDSWRYRIGRDGASVYYCADIETNMLEDSIAAVIALREAGFTELFLDDDLRQGNWSSEIQGCFCEECLYRFNLATGRRETRESLSERIGRKETSDVLREWVEFQCAKLTAFVEALAIPGITLGAMVMAGGDERHGIDIAAWRRALPAGMFRVGEHHFNDRDFGTPSGKAQDLIGIQKHLNGMPRATSYSETTCFPYRALSPANLIFKARLALASGVPNIMLMSGTYIYEEDYWSVWEEQAAELKKWGEALSPYERIYPVHFAYGTDGISQEPLHATTLPTLAGLPAKPVRGCDIDVNADDFDGELLLVFGDFSLDGPWERILPAYRTIVLDAVAARRNPGVADRSDHADLRLWPHEAGSAPGQAEIGGLRDFLSLEDRLFPHVVQGAHIVVLWVKERGGALLLNLETADNCCRVAFGRLQWDVALPPLSWKWLSLSEGSTTDDVGSL